MSAWRSTLAAPRRKAKWSKPRSESYWTRAKRFGVPYERIVRTKVYDRDGWICGICDEPVDPGLKYPDPMSVSLDHVVPLCAGGGHTYGNVQCSHLRCNVLKNDGNGGKGNQNGRPRERRQQAA